LGQISLNAGAEGPGCPEQVVGAAPQGEVAGVVRAAHGEGDFVVNLQAVSGGADSAVGASVGAVLVASADETLDGERDVA